MLPADRERLLAWYDAHCRDLPWRKSSDPYAVWVSEIMLQQTQVATVIPYWERWMARFPSVDSLANADEQDVLSHWQGLGYYRRGRLLQAGAKYVLEHGLPTNAGGWLAVPGVGRYTAGAIASIAQGLPAALVDGNVERVFARLTACPSSGAALTKAAWVWAEDNLHRAGPGDWNQALMELGATVCRPQNPDCPSCPIKGSCTAVAEGDPTRFPTRVGPRSTVVMNFHVLVPLSVRGRFGVRQIPPGQWWEGMWEFPREDSLKALPNLEGKRTNLPTVRHSVTHHRITLHVERIEVESEDPGLTWLTPDEMEDLPMPAPQRKIYRSALDEDGTRSQPRLPLDISQSVVR